MPELIRPTQAELDNISHPDKDALILWLFDVLARHEQRLSEVEGRVEKTSQNSSKLPSGWLQEGTGSPATGREATRRSTQTRADIKQTNRETTGGQDAPPPGNSPG